MDGLRTIKVLVGASETPLSQLGGDTQAGRQTLASLAARKWLPTKQLRSSKPVIDRN